MFNNVHHVRILVYNTDDMVEYMDTNFGMRPIKVQVYKQRGMKNAIYKVGDTNLEITEPLDCLLYTSPSPRDRQKSRMPSSA